MTEIVNILSQFFTGSYSAKGITFYEYLKIKSDSNDYNMSVGQFIKLMEVLNHQPISLLNDVCEGSIDYFNEYGKFIVYASSVIEYYSDQINKKLLCKYAKINTNSLSFAMFPKCLGIIQGYKMMKSPELVSIVTVMKLYEFTDDTLNEYLQKMKQICKVEDFDYSNVLDLIETSKSMKDPNCFITFLIDIEKVKDAVKFMEANIDKLDTLTWLWLESKLESNKIVLSSDNIIIKKLIERKNNQINES